MIIFINQDRHSYTHKQLIGELGSTQIKCRSYHWLMRQIRHPKATYIFTDRERMDNWELRVLGALFNHLKNAGPGYRVINDPAKMLNRRVLLNRLYEEKMNDFNVIPLVERKPPARYPVFIRRDYDHAQPLTGLLKDKRELDLAIDRLKKGGEPEDGVIIVEYCAEPVVDGLFRKLSAYQIGDKTMFYNTVHEHNWLVKQGSKNSATDELYAEEQNMVITNRFEQEIKARFELANIEYGRIDFGLVDGKIQTYEINTNPSTKKPNGHPNPIRHKTQQLAWERYLKALKALDTTDPKAPFAELFRCRALYRPKLKLFWGREVKRY